MNILNKRNIKHKFFITISIFLIFFVFILSINKDFSRLNNNDKKLALQQFYSNNIYSNIFKSGSDIALVNPYVDPQMGWRTDGKPVINPTKVAADGLNAILRGDIDKAESHAEWLNGHKSKIEKGTFFSFNFDFSPYWPYSLKAPWNSALTQGLSLGLFSILYDKTHLEKYKILANEVFESYKIPIEKGGFVRYEKEGPYAEEYPTEIPTRVLNGSAVALLAIHDYSVIFNNKDASKLFEKFVKRYELLLPDYEVKLPQYDFTLSSYSLAPVRNEILGRFIGEGKELITSIKLIGSIGTDEEIIESVNVGSLDDDNVMKDIYIWSDPIAMNWGDRTKENDEEGRILNNKIGSMNHSPFKFVYDKNFDKFTELYIEVSWKQNDFKKIDIQLYDENEYWALGEIAGNSGFHKKKFKISSEFLSSYKKLATVHSPIDNKYLDDNQILVKIIGEVSNSKVFKEFDKRWSNSSKLVPARWINDYPKEILFNETKNPLIEIIANSDQSKHDEYPHVIKIGNIYYMYYSGFGDDNRWRIFLATSNNGLNWIRQGQIFDESKLPFNGNYAFPSVVQNPNDNSDKKYLMYFSGAEELNTPYNKIYVAYSEDGLNWKFESSILNEPGLDPYIMKNEENKLEIYYTITDGNKGYVKRSISNNGFNFDKSEIIITRDQNMGEGLYTINGLDIGNHQVLLLENQGPANHSLLMFVKIKGEFVKYEKPIKIDKDWLDQWDAIKYGYNFFKDESKTYVYYNGITKIGAEIGGQIGRAEINLSILEGYVEKMIGEKLK